MVNGISALDGQYVEADSSIKHHKLSAPRGEEPIKYIILTHTAGTGDVADAARTMFVNGVGAHILVGKDGRITQVFEYKNTMTYTAGKSYFDGDTSLNKNSVFVMLGNQGRPEAQDFYPAAQVNTTKYLLNSLREEFPLAKVLELAEVATDRHIALGDYFPRNEIFDLVKIPAGTSFECKFNLNDSNNEIADIQTKLSSLGYDYNNAALAASGIYDEVNMKVANAFHNARVAHTEFTIVDGVFTPTTDGAPTLNCWSDADTHVLNILTGDLSLDNSEL